MRRAAFFSVVTLVVAAGLALMAVPAAAQPIQCGGLHALQVLDLDMTPDPAMQNQPIQRWIVKLRADGNGECATRVMVKDRDQFAGNAFAYTLRPGLNTINVPATPGYRMQGQDHCYVVFIDIQNSPRPIDGARQFCAKMIPPRPPGWSLK
jgi:hypothetical protein